MKDKEKVITDNENKSNNSELNSNKQIEEMARVMHERSREIAEDTEGIAKLEAQGKTFPDDFAEVLYNAGYRKERQGEWIYLEYSGGHYVGKCSLCECEADMTKYCPNCGARMKGE